MTKLESAEEIIEQDGGCFGIDCKDCCLDKNGVYDCASTRTTEEDLQLAIKYKKEHEMNEKFNIDNYKGEYAMHCKTEEEANIFCKFLNDNDKKWCSGDSYINKNNWKGHKEETCYNFNRGGYGTVRFFKKLEYSILEFDDFYWEELEFPYNLKKGDKVLLAGNKRIFLAFRPELLEPFELVHGSYEKEYLNGEKYNVTHWTKKDIKPLPKYKPYTEPKLEWIKEELPVKSNSTGFISNIVGTVKCIHNDWTLRLTNGEEVTLTKMLKDYSWQDGTPFGEVIK